VYSASRCLHGHHGGVGAPGHPALAYCEMCGTSGFMRMVTADTIERVDSSS
jgi:hypothetical protein